MTVSTVDPETPPRVALMVLVPVFDGGGQACCGDRCGCCRSGRPGDGAGEVLRAVVRVGSGGGELLGESLGHRRIGRSHCDRLQRGRDDSHDGGTGNTAEGRADGAGAVLRRWPGPMR